MRKLSFRTVKGLDHYHTCMHNKLLQLRPTLCDPMNHRNHEVPLSMGFSRQEYLSGLPCPSPGDIPDPGIKPRSPALQADSLPSELFTNASLFIPWCRSRYHFLSAWRSPVTFRAGQVCKVIDSFSVFISKVLLFSFETHVCQVQKSRWLFIPVL